MIGDHLMGPIGNACRILNRRNVSKHAECCCSACEASKDAAERSFACDRCGYRGRPYTIECACYDSMCHGGETTGAGCFHGALCCPVCDDGEADADPWAIIKQVRVALAGHAASKESGRC